MKTVFTLFIFLFVVSMSLHSQTIDFNKKYVSCPQDPTCAPFFNKQVYCDSPYTGSIVFYNLFGAPNYVNWKKSTSLTGRVNARAVRFRSSYSFPTSNYADGLALKKTFTKNKVYNISIVTSALRDENYVNYVSGLRVSLDKVDGVNHSNGADSCDIGQYSQLPDSYFFSDITPHLIDTNVAFNEALFTASYQTAAPDNYNYLGLRALPHSGVSQAALMVHKIVAQELNFKFRQSITTLYCGVPVNDSLILLNPDKIFGVSEYHWDLGPQPNGWYQGTTPAPQFITTVDSFLVLQWNGTSAPSKVNVVPFIGSTALAYTYQDAITYSNNLPPNAAIVGDTNIVTISPTNYTYTISNMPSGATIVWNVNTTLGSFYSSGSSANFIPYTEAGGTVLLKATVTNPCGISKPFQLTLHLTNSCDIYPLYSPTNLVGTPTSSPGMAALSWSAVPYVAGYTIEYKASDGSNDNVFDVPTNTTNYYGPSYVPGLFRVQSRCASGKISDWSAWQSFSTTPVSPCNLSPATNLTAVNACGGGYMCGYIQYSWTAVSGATQYELESFVFNPSTGGTFPTVTAQSSSNSAYISGYTPPVNGTGWLVKFRVRSRCSDGSWTSFSNWSPNYALN